MAGVDISAIVVNWNTRRLLLQCLRVLGSALHGLSHEIWVVDNGSQDGSMDAARVEFPAAQIIANQENLGYARAVNQALARLTGRYVLLLNTDALPMADAIHYLYAFLEKNPEAAAVGGQLLHPEGTRQNSIANFPSLTTELLNKSLLQMLLSQRFPGKGRHYADPVEVESVVGACLLVRAEVIDEIGPLDEGYFFFLEETDWCYRMQQTGYKIYHVPQARIYHLQGASVRGFEAESRIEYHRARFRFFRKHRGRLQTGLLAGGTLFRVGMDAVTLGLLSLLTGLRDTRVRRKAWVAFRLFAWYLRGCPAAGGLPRISETPSAERADAAGG
ncbi:MAG: glycosyltransferase family 2 protein [Candidatus Methylomirabilales bacterium]